jgi:hypothetical protein
LGNLKNGVFNEGASLAYPASNFGQPDYFVDVNYTVGGSYTAVAGMTLTWHLNRLAKTNFTYSARKAANIWAGTSGLDLKGALNAKAGTSGYGIARALNIIAGTTNLTAQDAASRIPTP